MMLFSVSKVGVWEHVTRIEDLGKNITIPFNYHSTLINGWCSNRIVNPSRYLR